MELRLRQHLTLTPQLQQALRLLQLSSLEFEQEMRAALTANPFLEDEEEAEDTPSATPEAPPEPATVEADAPASGDDDPADARLGFEDLPRAAAAHDDDESDWTEWSEAQLTLRDHTQAGCSCRRWATEIARSRSG
jgi:RNA polymerase sigma-54 factor